MNSRLGCWDRSLSLRVMCFCVSSYHFRDWPHFKSQRIIHASQLQSDASDERASLNMNVSSCLPVRVSVNWIVFVKPNWQDPHLHTRSTNHSAIPIRGWQERRGRLLAGLRRKRRRRRKKKERKASQETIGAPWHPQEANANLQLCHFSPHRHPKCCSCEVMSVVMVTVCEPGIARPLTFL